MAKGESVMPLLLRLSTWLSNEDIRGTCVLAKCLYESKWQWYCRLSWKKRTITIYGQDFEKVLTDALDEMEGKYE